MRYATVDLANYGYIQAELTEEQLAPLKAEIAEIQADFESRKAINLDLAGQIKKEYQLSKSVDHIEKMLMPLVKEYEMRYDYLKHVWLPTKNPLKIALKKLWVNFQSKHEFNPPHDHTGILSFVIWIKIPYNMQNETAAGPGKDSHVPCNGQFGFLYTDTLGQMLRTYIPADCSMEGTVLLFPSKLNHVVFPFYSSDEYRISVSGNFNFDLPF